MSDQQRAQHEAMQAQQQMAEEQADQQVKQMSLQQADQQAQQIRSDLLEKVSDSDLNADSRNLLENLVSKDFIFANLTDKEVTEFKYKLLLKRRKFYTLHPSQESIIEGQFRAYVYDDPGNTLTSLTQQEKLIVDQFFEGIFMRVTRARGMKQQEILQTQIRQALTGDLGADSSKSGGLIERFKS